MAVNGASVVIKGTTGAAAEGVTVGRMAVSRGGMLGSVDANCGIPGILTAEPGRVETGGSEKAPAGENDIGGRGMAEGKAKSKEQPSTIPYQPKTQPSRIFFN